MDIDELREKWNDPEYAKSFPELSQVPPMAMIRRKQKMHELAAQRRNKRRMMMKSCVAALLVLASFRLFHSHGKEARLQSVAFILVMAAIWGLQKLDQEREKDERSKVWLPFKDFLKDEYRRIDHIIRLDQGAAFLLCLGVASVGMYAVPFLSAGLQLACWAVTAAAIVIIQLYEQRKISRLKLMRDDVAAELKNLHQE
jgi:hypothetical protein